jgi:hypothetical protein
MLQVGDFLAIVSLMHYLPAAVMHKEHAHAVDAYQLALTIFHQDSLPYESATSLKTTTPHPCLGPSA